MPSRHALFFPVPRGAGRHTPDPWARSHGRGSSLIISPALALPRPPRRPRALRARKGRAARRAAAGRPEGSGARPCPCTQVAHRPPALGAPRRGLPGADSPRSPKIAASFSADAPLRVSVAGARGEAPPGFRPPGQRPPSPASSTAGGRGTAPRKATPGELASKPVAVATRHPPHTARPPQPALADPRPQTPVPHLRRAPVPGAPPGPAVYTGSDVRGRPRPRPRRPLRFPGRSPPSPRAGWAVSQLSVFFGLANLARTLLGVSTASSSRIYL